VSLAYCMVDKASCELILTIAHNIYASTVHGQSSSCHLLSRILKMVEEVLKPGVNRMMFLEHFLPQTQVRVVTMASTCTKLTWRRS